MGCDDLDCTDLVCGADPFCCDTQWDQLCADAATADCAVCEGGGGGGGDDCCTANGTPACDDATCTADVCAVDPFCCSTEWDGICADEAAQMCEACGAVFECGDGACNGEETCETCDVDCGACPECGDGECNGVEGCDTCADDCGACEGDCCDLGETPGCDDADITACVCAADDFCCAAAWDELCVQAAYDGCGCVAECGDGVCDAFAEDCGTCEADCGACPPDCCEANGTPQCEDELCTASVCAIDPFCCESQWDGLCADCAMGAPGVDGVDCAEAGLDCPCGYIPPVCGDGQCTTGESCESCEEDCGACPFCGDGTCDPDEDCVTCADDCTTCEGDCCGDNGTVGCDDSVCTASVCAVDPYCCENNWDADCAGCAMGELSWQGEDCTGAALDCECGYIPPVCGDGECTTGESCETCSDDCGACPFCGDGECNGDEDCTTCADDCMACEGDCCADNGTVGCMDAACTELVCSIDSFCCASSWDSLCGDEATQYCETCGGGVVCGDGECGPGEDCETCSDDCGVCPFCGDGECGGDEGCDSCPDDCGACEGDCCAVGETAGCDDADITACVCELDEFCCNSSWDGLCVQAAFDDCGCVAECGDGVCDEFAEDCSTCEADCGACPPDCCDANGTPECEDAACTDAVCALDPFCCESSWDGLCAGCANGQPGVDGIDCATAGEACPCGYVPPVCGDGECTTGESCETCTDDCGACPFCGDGECNGDEICTTCPDDCGACTASCCEAHEGVGCEDPACTAAVCAVDPFCCDSSWDGICAGEGVDLCEVCGATAAAPCCAPHAGMGCDDLDCETLICSADPFCCETQWDETCAAAAMDGCAACQGPMPGDCCEPGETLGCDDAACTDAVCAVDPFCCDTQWDGICADEALDMCEVCAGAGAAPCCAAHGGVGCEDIDCTNAVCSIDPFCCDTAWDTACAETAMTACPGCAGGGPGDCCSAHDGAGCADALCVEAVCAVDPFCCDTTWDDLCAGQAMDLCEVCGGGVAGCGDGVCDAAPPTDVAATIQGFAFVPPVLEIVAGDSITWTNLDGAPHTVTSDTGLFDSGTLTTGESWSMTFDEPGEYPYFCAIHPFMTGLVVVLPAPPGAETCGTCAVDCCPEP